MTSPTTTGDRAEILLIDLSAIFWRFAYAPDVEELADSAQARTVQKVRGLARGFDGGGVAICVDDVRSFRHDMLPSYKANRAAKPPQLKVQLKNAIHQLTLDGFPMWRFENCEADDVIASAVRAALAAGHRVTIATGDKDLLQLLGADVCVLSTSTDAIVTESEMLSKFGVGPRQIADWIALVGDKSDNIPGVPGCGPVNAAKLLTSYSDVLGIIDAARDEQSEIKPKMREALLASQEALALACRLVALKSDLPIDIAEALRPRVAAPLTKQEDWDGPAGQEDRSMSESDRDEAKNPANHDGQPGDDAPDSEERPAAREPAPAPEQQQIVTRPAEAEQFQPGGKSTTIVAAPDWQHTLEPTSLRDAMAIAQRLHNSRLFPQFNNAEGIFAAVLLARAHGVETMKMLMPGMVHNIKGKLSLSAQLIVGLVLRSGKCEHFDLVESTTELATYTTKRKGSSRAVTMTFTIGEAKAAGYLAKQDGAWQKTPKTMLRHRCETELARAVYPDVVGGLYSHDEMENAA